MKKLLLAALLLVSINQLLLAQNFLVSATEVDFASSDEISSSVNLPVPYGVRSYKVLYNTKDVLGNDHVASGLISVPEELDLFLPLIAIQHGTVGSRWDVPSALSGGYEFGLIFSSFGFVSAQADYIGLGESQGIHPYIHAESEATAGRDLLRAARELVVDLDITLNDQIFLTGYSQGGHASMSLHKMLETEFSSEFEVTAASHMSGPYSVSEVMQDFTLGDENYFTPAYLAWVTLSMKAAYPSQLMEFSIEDIFKPQYIDPINRFINEEINLWDLNTIIISELVEDVGTVTPKDMLTDGFFDLINSDEAHPFNVALGLQDVYDWAPIAPTRLMYCSADEQVSYENALLAEMVMTENGANDVVAIQNGINLDHSECVTPAVTRTLAFFRELVLFMVNTEDLESKNYLNVSLVNQELQIRLTGKNYGSSVYLNDANGGHLKLPELNNGAIDFDVSEFPNGVYFLQLIQEGQLKEVERILLVK